MKEAYKMKRILHYKRTERDWMELFLNFLFNFGLVFSTRTRKKLESFFFCFDRGRIIQSPTEDNVNNFTSVLMGDPFVTDPKMRN